MPTSSVITVKNLRKTYGATVAVEDISFEVGEGEIFGMVGPNGAGKTTTIECLEGLRRPDRGEMRVLGLDPVRQEHQLRLGIGTQLQQTSLPERLTVGEALDLFASIYPHPADWRALMEQLSLADKRNAYVSKLSGGQRQRLFIALALINSPRLVFLDELTTGVDPQARHAIWDLVRSICAQNKTVFLTTHLMEEAEQLCDRVAIVDHGRLVALDTPANLIRGLEAESRVVFTPDNGYSPEPLKALAGVSRVEKTGQRVVIYGQANGHDGHAPLVAQIVTALAAQNVHFTDLRTEQPNLEDVFLSLTGRAMRD